MPQWLTQKSSFFGTRFKKFEKRHKEEAANLAYNAQSYLDALEAGAKVLQIRDSFIHHEGEGMVAVDQRNRSPEPGTKKSKKQMKESRLYLYADEKEKVLYMLTVGDKDTQQRDIGQCKEFVRTLKKTEDSHD